MSGALGQRTDSSEGTRNFAKRTWRVLRGGRRAEACERRTRSLAAELVNSTLARNCEGEQEVNDGGREELYCELLIHRRLIASLIWNKSAFVRLTKDEDVQGTVILQFYLSLKPKTTFSVGLTLKCSNYVVHVVECGSSCQTGFRQHLLRRNAYGALVAESISFLTSFQPSDPSYRDDPSRVTGRHHRISGHSADMKAIFG
eukprot:228996-Hanusia_phi.AAC.9